MIKVDKGKVELNGDVTSLLAELGVLIINMCNNISVDDVIFTTATAISMANREKQQNEK